VQDAVRESLVRRRGPSSRDCGIRMTSGRSGQGQSRLVKVDQGAAAARERRVHVGGDVSHDGGRAFEGWVLFGSKMGAVGEFYLLTRLTVWLEL
jgi:hypothetical protein